MNERLMRHRSRGVRIWTLEAVPPASTDSALPANSAMALRYQSRGVKIWSTDAIGFGHDTSGEDDSEGLILIGTTNDDVGTVTDALSTDAGGLRLSSFEVVGDAPRFTGSQPCIRTDAIDGGRQNEAGVADEGPMNSSDGKDGAPTLGSVVVDERVSDTGARLGEDAQPASDALPHPCELEVEGEVGAHGIEVRHSNDDEDVPEPASVDAHDESSFDGVSDISAPIESEPVTLPPTVLAVVEALLAVQVGPVARLLVARHSAQVTDLLELEALLVSSIPSSAGREQFRTALAKALRETAYCLDPNELGMRDATRDVEHNTGSGGTAVLQEQVQAAAMQLAHYLGPIAHVVAKRKAVAATDLRTYYEHLAQSISNEADRAAFQRTMLS